ncbi:MAG: 4Fe-4S dicluster domain-containing protein [archaeon]|nr:4Fe-4S dicluster domain-containing protein [archaeon]
MASESQEESKSGKKKYQIIVVDPNRCVGCEICESVCSMVHDGEYNPLNSRINRIRIEPIINTAINCQSCHTPDCVEVCQAKALKKDIDSGLIKVNETKCEGCAACVRACPFGAINVHTKLNKAIVCDMCESVEDGEPQCKVYCPKDAIFIEEIDADSDEDSMEVLLKILKRGFGEIEYEEGTIIKRSHGVN